MKSSIDKNVLVSAIALGVFGVLGATIVATTHLLTADRIKANEVAARLKQINEILPHDQYNNDLLNDSTVVKIEGLPTTVYRARLDNKNIAAIMQTTAPNGYSGPIKLLIGIKADGIVAGVRVLSHTETPGLGDQIELRKSPWVLGFTGKSLDNPSRERWAVKKDGGVFDQFTGATITPRLVTKAVRDSLVYFKEHRKAIFAPHNKAETQ